MGLRTSLARAISRLLLQNKKTRREILRNLYENDVLVYRKLVDHFLIYYPHDVIGESISAHGEFSRTSVRKLRDFLKRSDHPITDGSVLEIGANIGTHTIYFFKDIKARHVVAVEPDPENYEILSQNIKLNGLEDYVSLIKLGASNKPGQLPFNKNSLNRGGSHFGDSSESAINVDVTTVDEIFKTNQKKLQDLKLIWIDVEGHELQVLEGAQETIQTQKPTVFMEYTPHADQFRNARLGDILFKNFEAVFDFRNLNESLTPETFGKISSATDLLAIHTGNTEQSNYLRT
nr:FkbM family methyltransferase [Ruegeria arenilitoris]